jgi:predicted XRE-type DNA-binding protein
MTAKVRRSSGNVFQDLGFSAEESESLRLRAELMVQIRRLIEGRKLTQAAAAKMLAAVERPAPTAVHDHHDHLPQAGCRTAPTAGWTACLEPPEELQ